MAKPWPGHGPGPATGRDSLGPDEHWDEVADAMQVAILDRPWPVHLGMARGTRGLAGRAKLAPRRQIAQHVAEAATDAAAAAASAAAEAGVDLEKLPISLPKNDGGAAADDANADADADGGVASGATT